MHTLSFIAAIDHCTLYICVARVPIHVLLTCIRWAVCEQEYVFVRLKAVSGLSSGMWWGGGCSDYGVKVHADVGSEMLYNYYAVPINNYIHHGRSYYFNGPMSLPEPLTYKIICPYKKI